MQTVSKELALKSMRHVKSFAHLLINTLALDADTITLYTDAPNKRINKSLPHAISHPGYGPAFVVFPSSTNFFVLPHIFSDFSFVAFFDKPSMYRTYCIRNDIDNTEIHGFLVIGLTRKLQTLAVGSLD